MSDADATQTEEQTAPPEQPPVAETPAPPAGLERFGDASSDDFDWEGFLGEYYGETPPPEAEPESSAEVAPPAELENSPEGSASGPSGEPPAPLMIGEVEIPAEHAERVANLWSWMNENPNEAADFMGYVLGEKVLVDPKLVQQPGVPPVSAEGVTATPPPAVAPVPIDMSGPEWEYIPDPLKEQIGALTSQNATLAEQQTQLAAFLQQQAEAQEHQQRLQAVQAVEDGVADFRTRFPAVTDLELEMVRQEAARLNIAANLTDSLGSAKAGVSRALEIAYFAQPEFRARENQTAAEAAVQQEQQDTTRKRKLGALAGSGGATPQPVSPSTPEARRAAMVNDIKAAVFGQDS